MGQFKLEITEKNGQEKTEKFYADLTEALKKLNNTFKNYTTLTDKNVKIRRLQQLLQQRRYILTRFHAKLVRSLDPATLGTLQNYLYDFVAEEARALGVPSMYRFEDYDFSQEDAWFIRNATVSEFIANLSQEKATLFIDSFLDTKTTLEELSNVYDKEEEGFKAYQDFLADISAITHINPDSGTGNLVFKVTFKNRSPLIFKIFANDRDVTHAEERLLQHKTTQNYFVPVYYERHVSQVGAYRKLAVSPFCDGGNLKELSQKLAQRCLVKNAYKRYLENNDYINNDCTRLLSIAYDVSLQHADFILKCQALGCAYVNPEAKNLLIHKGFLSIANRSAIVETANGAFDPMTRKLKIHPAYIPPEYKASPDSKIKMRAFSAYQYGRYLYEFLTGCHEDTDTFDFNHPIFRIGDEGVMLQEMITQLTEADPSKRLPIGAAIIVIKRLQGVTPSDHASVTLQKNKNVAYDLIDKLEPILRENSLYDTQVVIQNYRLQVVRAHDARKVQGIIMQLNTHIHRESKKHASIAVRFFRLYLQDDGQPPQPSRANKHVKMTPL